MSRPGRAVCRDHERSEEGQAVGAAVARLGREAMRAMGGPSAGSGQAEEEQRRAEALFRRRLEGGEYQGLIDERLRQILEQAADEKGLRDELGALRVVLMRLLVEEQDLDKLARNVSRVATATARIRRVQEQVGEGPNAELQAFVDRIWEAFALPADEEVPRLRSGGEESDRDWVLGRNATERGGGRSDEERDDPFEMPE